MRIKEQSFHQIPQFILVFGKDFEENVKNYARDFINEAMGDLMETGDLLDVMTYMLVKGNLFEEDCENWKGELYTHCQYVRCFSDPERKAVHLHFELMLEAMERLVQD